MGLGLEKFKVQD